METRVGVQVLMTAFNAEKYLQDSLDSILPAVKGIPWVFIFNSDGSTDSTFEIAKKFGKTCGAKHIVIKKTKKAKTIGAAKNKTFKYINKFRDEYPYICVHDSDDIMGKNRIKGLQKAMKKYNVPFVYGSFEYNEQFIAPADKLDSILKFGIWNTLFHEQLIPTTGKFFNEKVYAFEDLIKWWDLRYKHDVELKPIPSVITTHYIKRPQSMTKLPVDPKHSAEMKDIRNKVHPYPPID